MKSRCIFCFISLMTSCIKQGHHQDSKPKEMVEAKFLSEQEIQGIPLAKADALGIPYRVFEMKIAIPDGHRVTSSVFLDFRFGKLSESQFRSLISAYNGEAATTYNPEREYKLQNFLPRFVQATIGHQFVGHYYKVVDNKLVSMTSAEAKDYGQAAEIISNCWGSAYEYLRRPEKGFDVFYAESGGILRVLADAKYVEPVSKPQQGDVLLIKGGEPGRYMWLDHAAINIDEDLFFERTGRTDYALFRFVTLKTLNNTYAPVGTRTREGGYIVEGDATYEYYRLKKDVVLPEPSALLRSGISDLPADIGVATETGIPGIEGLVNIAYQANPDGSYSMEQNAFSKEHFDRLFGSVTASELEAYLQSDKSYYCFEVKTPDVCSQYRKVNKGVFVNFSRENRCRFAGEGNCPDTYPGQSTKQTGICTYSVPVPDGLAEEKYYALPNTIPASTQKENCLNKGYSWQAL